MKHKPTTPNALLTHHVSGAIERGEASPIAGIPADSSFEREYQAGYKNGSLHGSPLPKTSPETASILYAENEAKALTAPDDGTLSDNVRSYWSGYRDAMNATQANS